MSYAAGAPDWDAYKKIIDDIREKFMKSPRIAIMGFGNSGKSSLYNAIFGEQRARVSMRTDETKETRTETHEGLGMDLTDTPGFGTKMFSLEKLVAEGFFNEQHVIIHVLNGTAAISDQDAELKKYTDGSLAQYVLAVNKVDLLDDEERQEMSESLRLKLKVNPASVQWVSAKKRIGIEALIAHILEILPEALQDAFVREQKANEELKYKRSRRAIHTSAVAAATAAAVGNIPVSDLLLITPIQVGMVATIGAYWGADMSPRRAAEFVATLTGAFALREAARQLLKLIPGYGNVVSAVIAYAGTVAMGEAAILWFHTDGKASQEDLRKAYMEAFNRAKSEYRKPE